MISNIRGIVCVIVTLSAVFVLASRTDLFAENVEPQGDNVVKYEANWESLKKYGYDQKAEWLKDAKFGIYTHWGPSTYPISMCPVVAGWYPRRMYETFFSNGRVFEFHKETFGDQHKVGYKDLIPLFKAEKFDAEEWARLF